MASTISAAGVSYEVLRPSRSERRYTDTILKSDGIAASAGDCIQRQTVPTTGGAQRCEGAYVEHGVDTSGARRLVVQAPPNITLTNSPNKHCLELSQLEFHTCRLISHSENAGVIALTCGSSTAVANTFETALTSGAVDLRAQARAPDMATGHAGSVTDWLTMSPSRSRPTRRS